MENPLAELVTAHCERTGDTLAAIAKRGGISRQTLSGLVNREGPRAFPRQGTLDGLAKGLDLPLESVRQIAAVAAYGEATGESPRRLVGILIAHAEGLSDDQLEVVLATARAVKRHAS
jgi:transcriptional regulator with XRE-family HTH domain